MYVTNWVKSECGEWLTLERIYLDDGQKPLILPIFNKSSAHNQIIPDNFTEYMCKPYWSELK